MNHYQTLGIHPSSSRDEISKAFKKLAVKYHPDKSGNPAHHELFLRISTAYEVLKSEESRSKYDLEIGVAQVKKQPRYSTGAPSGFYNFTLFTGFFSERYADRFTSEERFAETKRANMEKLRKDAELRAKKEAEKVARREQELKDKARRAAEVQRRAQEELGKLQKQESSDSPNEDIYNQRKRQAYRAHWNQPFRTFNEDVFHTKTKSALTRRGIQTDPIVISEEDGDLEEEAEETENEEDQAGIDNDNANDNDNDNESENEVEIVEESTINAEEYKQQEENRNEQEHTKETGEEKEEKGKKSKNTSKEQNNDDIIDKQNDQKENKYQGLKSNKRSTKIPIPDDRPHQSEFFVQEGFKRQRKNTEKSFLLDDLENSLKSDIGNVDFHEVLESLPNYKEPEPTNGKMRSNKRVKIAEYSNGKSKADTLHKPVNSVPIHNNINMSDFNANPNVKLIIPPPVPNVPEINVSLAKSKWNDYTEDVKQYRQKFFEYKTKIITYQMERASRDKELFNLINDEIEVFKVYQKCLQQDVEVMSVFSDSLGKFERVMENYRQHSTWQKVIESFK